MARVLDGPRLDRAIVDEIRAAVAEAVADALPDIVEDIRAVLSEEWRAALAPRIPIVEASSPFKDVHKNDLATTIARLESELCRLKQQQRDEADRRLLTAIIRGIGFRTFDVRLLQARRVKDPELAAALGDLDSVRLGKRFARMVGRDLYGWSISRVKETEDGWLWEIHFHEPSTREAVTRAE